MKTTLSMFSLLILVFVLGCTPKGGGGEAQGGGDKKIKLVLNWVPEPEFGGFFAAREEGAYKKEGLSVEIVNGGAGVPVVQMVATGQADFGVVAAEELINARTKGADLVPVFATFQKSPQAIMAHASRGHKTLADVFSGGTMALETGTSLGAFLKFKFGFDKVSVVPYDGGIARFVADKNVAQQCFATSEPLAARKQGSDPQVFLLADEGYNPYATVVATRSEVWKKSPELVRAFVRASREGWKSYLVNPKPANDVMAKQNTTMDAATFAEVSETQKPFLENEDTQKRGFGVMTRERWEALGKKLVEIGFLKEAPRVDDYLFTID